jgi:hypothetical protein
MPDRYAKQFNFQYPYLVMARVTAVYTLAQERKILVDASALDARGSWQKVPVSLPPGMVRNYRKGQIVGLLFRHSASNFPTAIAHIHNLETSADYTDPVPPPFAFVDDHVVYHPETGAFMRFRSATSTAAAGGGDAQPAIVEITLATGASLIITESDSTHAHAALLMPSGASIVIDTEGIITATSPKKVVVVAPDVELGDDTSRAAASANVRQADLDNVVQQVNAFEAVFNAHIHSGVAGGTATSGTTPTPATAAQTPPCSATVFSE